MSKCQTHFDICWVTRADRLSDSYFTAILTLSLPILAKMIVSCLVWNETLPSIDFAVSRFLPSREKKMTVSSLTSPAMLMNPPADWISMLRSLTDSIPLISSIALIVPNPLQGSVV